MSLSPKVDSLKSEISFYGIVLWVNQAHHAAKEY